jgi:hypothetical protein
MQDRIKQLFLKMIDFDHDADLIQHFTKVHSYCRLIAACEGVDDHTAEVLEAAALVHDIAIPLCNENTAGSPQFAEKEARPGAGNAAGLDFSAKKLGPDLYPGGRASHLSAHGRDRPSDFCGSDFFVNSLKTGCPRRPAKIHIGKYSKRRRARKFMPPCLDWKNKDQISLYCDNALS